VKNVHSECSSSSRAVTVRSRTFVDAQETILTTVPVPEKSLRSSIKFKWAASDASKIESLWDDGHCFHLPSDGYSYPQIQDCTGDLDQCLNIGFAQCQ
jgi:hypothetical protein